MSRPSLLRSVRQDQPRGMDCSPADGGIRLGPSPAVPYPRSRPRLWRGGHPAPPGPGDQRSTDIAAITLAECLCGTADRLGPPRVRRPCCCVWRTAPSPPVARVQELLQRDAHAPVLEQGRTVTACRPGDRPHYQPSDLGRAPSPILPDLICGRDTELGPWKSVRATQAREARDVRDLDPMLRIFGEQIAPIYRRADRLVRDRIKKDVTQRFEQMDRSTPAVTKRNDD